MVATIKVHFENTKQQQNYYTMWQEISYRKILTEHPDRTPMENLEDLFRKLETMQRAIQSLDKGDRLLRDQLINAMRDYPACSVALQVPADTYEGVCAQLRTSISLANGQNGAAAYTSTSN